MKRQQTNCHCAAYPFVHRLDSGACRKLYNAQAKEEAEYDAYFAQRGITYGQRQEFESGHSTKDFG